MFVVYIGVFCLKEPILCHFKSYFYVSWWFYVIRQQSSFLVFGSRLQVVPVFLFLTFSAETFMTALAVSSPHGCAGPSHPQSSGSPLSPPSWTRLSERPPGLKTYRSSSRGALRLTIKQESGSRKVVHNSACDPRFKRDHAGQLTNGGGAPNGALQLPNGALSGGSEGQRGPASKSKSPSPPSEPEDVFDPRDAPKLKRYRSETPPRPERRFSPLPPPLQEDSMLSEHLQSAIDSILELQRLQGPPAPRAAAGPSLDQAVTSILGGHL